jgi:hypothetical protein
MAKIGKGIEGGQLMNNFLSTVNLHKLDESNSGFLLATLTNRYFQYWWVGATKEMGRMGGGG